MSLFQAIATFTLTDQWQFTDVLVGSYFRVVHLTQPLNQDGQLQESSAAIAQADITGFIYTQDDFSHQTDPQSFILEQPDSLQVRTIGLRLLPNQTPWQIRVEALDVTRLPGAGGYSVGAIDDLLGLKANVSAVYTKAEVDALLAGKADKPARPSAKDLLEYTASDGKSGQSYPYGLNPATADDNETTTWGVVFEKAGSSDTLDILVTFTAAKIVNEIVLYPGDYQGTGVWNPTELVIRAASLSGAILATVPIASGSPVTIDLLTYSGLDTPRDVYCFSFSNAEAGVSIKEIDLFGAVA